MNKVYHKVIPHSKRIDIIYLHQVHGMSVNQISKTFNFHYTTVDKIIWLFKQMGRTSKPYDQCCPVSRQNLEKYEVEIIDLKYHGE